MKIYCQFYFRGITLRHKKIQTWTTTVFWVSVLSPIDTRYHHKLLLWISNLTAQLNRFRVKSKSKATKTNCRKQSRNQKAKLIVTTSRLTSSLQASLVFRRKFWSASANGFVSSSLLLSSNHANDFFCLKLRPASGASGKYWLLYFLSGCFSPLKKDTTFCFQASLTTWKILAYDLRAKKKSKCKQTYLKVLENRLKQ